MSAASDAIRQAAPGPGAIALYARATEGFGARLAHALQVLQRAAEEFPGQIVQATSLGAEDMVITDLIARHRLDVAVGTLQTGMLHAQTLALIDTIRSHYAMPVEVVEPQKLAVIEFVQRHGERAMYDSIELRKACCGVRKLEPLSRLLSTRRAWVTGMRRDQSAQRGGVLERESDDQGRAKFNPLAEWTWADVWHYIAIHQVPYNPLHDQFYPSIGCAPCTRAIAVGEDFRAGRWWWENDATKECGLHVSQTTSSTTGAAA